MKRHAVLLVVAVAGGGRLQADSLVVRPFLFTVTPAAGTASERWVVHYDTGYGERTAAPIGYDGLEQRVGVQGDLGAGLTVLAQLGLGVAREQSSRTTQEAEVLKRLRAPTRGLQIAAGTGLRREWEGTTVLLGRITVGRPFERAGVFANVRFEKPLAEGRDSVDLITSLGFHRQLASAVHLGVEAIGEDLEGFWEAEEAEGGAKVFVGPSVRVAPVHARFSATLCGGPILYATHSARDSGAPRPLGARGNGYTVRLSVAYSF